jgi:hypothetical protein
MRKRGSALLHKMTAAHAGDDNMSGSRTSAARLFIPGIRAPNTVVCRKLRQLLELIRGIGAICGQFLAPSERIHIRPHHHGPTPKFGFRLVYDPLLALPFVAVCNIVPRRLTFAHPCGNGVHSDTLESRI